MPEEPPQAKCCFLFFNGSSLCCDARQADHAAPLFYNLCVCVLCVCVLNCTCVPTGPGGNKTATAKDMGVSETAVTYAKALRKGKVSVFPTKAECCMPALGAYPAGCTSRA